MSTYLSRLIAQARGRAVALRIRPRTRFEMLPGDFASEDSESWALPAAPDEQPPALPVPRVPGAADPRSPSHAFEVPPTVTAAAPQPSETGDTPVGRHRERIDATVTPSTRVEHTLTTVEREEYGAEPMAIATSSIAARLSGHVDGETETMQQLAGQASLQPPSPRPLPGVSVAPKSAGPRPPESRNRKAITVPAMQFKHAAAEASSEVTVIIGRLDVRVVPGEGGNARARPAKERGASVHDGGAPALADYLRGRQGR